jgi:hypothetical protein
MTEYSRHIEFYKVHEHSSFSRMAPESEWGNKKLAQLFLAKYWLTEEEYLKVWQPLQNKIFVKNIKLPDLLFTPNYKILVSKGGCLFTKEDFESLQKAVKPIADNYIIIIQATQDFTKGEPMFRLKFPANISWEEIISGNYISAVIFERNYNEYFVFSESASWGRYSANDCLHPIDITGYKPEYESLFKEQFPQSNEEQEEIMQLLRSQLS